MYRRRRNFIFVFLMLAGCQGAASQREIRENEAIAIADRHFARTLPQVPRNMLRAVAVGQGATWRVDYYPPEGSFGGTTIVVDKRSGRVVGFVIHQ